MTFAVLVFIAIVILAFGLSNRIPGDDQPAVPAEPCAPGSEDGPPRWVFTLMPLALILSMFLFAWIFPD